MFKTPEDDAGGASWWRRLTQALLREPSVVLLERDADTARAKGGRDASMHSCKAVRQA